ncbi:hypothetical protein A4X06_0g8058 [Tilletia controversa]|uniref:Uncharacterized protein n=1 Tax=Tilletia controversa TaxID=13291 RepID=A0A8X7MKY2_9BASI|nr:hypothetical protein CF335_g9263 [Tilletia laevis]KAE8181160.1 hypothetical protein CF328_g8926 [Tilletia controversa]KAE8239767.1 hypothetical protein A4X06_0g8058 [Tilletia controversa]
MWRRRRSSARPAEGLPILSTTYLILPTFDPPASTPDPQGRTRTPRISKSPMPTKSAWAIDGGSQLAEPRTASAGENSISNSAVKMPSTNTGMDMSASTSTSGGSTGKSQRSRTSRFVAAFHASPSCP